MPSPIDQRRLRDGARALEVSSTLPATVTEARVQLETVGEGLAALQSLDDLGPTANDQASRDERELWKRHEAIVQRLRQLEQKEPHS